MNVKCLWPLQSPNMPGGCGTEWRTLDSRWTNKQTDGQLTTASYVYRCDVSRGGTPDTRMWARDGRLGLQRPGPAQLSVLPPLLLVQ